ncbi:hypothetical protein FHP29_04960 [Nocardioides albidus]|uniref:DUF6318 domain-containing protein n=1 Tax=Nocardioides albidus TaxID=1517589 RepID=A0A5C4WAC0_9ACTN|nr:DUF6318 family protein [Nocardioides albidus]TNM45158.1 hypothetical protein FHP29_04960 [Nocardioides albidus]
MRTALALTAIVATLALGGCGDDDTEPGDPTSTWTPTGTMEAPTSPTADPLTEAPADETARQFIRRWVALGNQMQATGETAGFLATAGPDCTSCHKFAKKVERIYRNGGYIRGGTDQIIAMQAESDTQWVVTLVAKPTEYAETPGGEVKSFDGGTHRSRVYLAHIDGRWIVGATEGVPL